jgi:GxxExxY protein
MRNRRRQLRERHKFDGDDYPLHELTREIIAACFCVHNVLGYGFLESIYRRALVIELQIRGFSVSQEVPFEMTYIGAPIGTYRADLVVESSVLLEIKTSRLLDPSAVRKPSTISARLACLSASSSTSGHVWK